MAKKEKQEFVTIVTPICPTTYNHLNKPDEYQGKKTYKTTLVLTPEELDEIKDVIDAEVEKAYEAAVAEIEGTLKGKKQRDALAELKKTYPYDEQEDDDGELTGDYTMLFKSNPKPNGKRRFAIVDSQGKPTNVLVYGGSKIRIEAYLKPYYMKATGKVGVTLYISAVQIVELAGDSGDGPTRHSFGKIEGGYVGRDDEDDRDDQTSGGGDDDDDGDDNNDF